MASIMQQENLPAVIKHSTLLAQVVQLIEKELEVREEDCVEDDEDGEGEGSDDDMNEEEYKDTLKKLKDARKKDEEKKIGTEGLLGDDDDDGESDSDYDWAGGDT